MELLLSALRGLSEYKTLTDFVGQGKTAALSGIGGLARAHVAAALYGACQRPMVLVCQDELAAARLQEELAAFLGQAPAMLPTRELTFYDASVVSRGWEQKRLRQLYDLAMGRTKLLVASLEAMTLRTVPKATLFSAAVTLKQGAAYDLDAMANKLTAMGYARTTLVEGVGQFAVRGGILDSYLSSTGLGSASMEKEKRST